jgi:hypothetical protein
MKLCLLLLAAALHLQSYAAVVVTDGARISWDFTLAGTGAGSTEMDWFTIQFGTDRLLPGESLLITIAAKGQSNPTYTRTMVGFGSGTNGLLSYGELDATFPAREGTVSIEMLQGAVDVHHISIILHTPTYSASTSITPDIHLVPEPHIPVMVMAASFVWILRRPRPLAQP